MLDQTFGQVYTKFKLHFYKQIFQPIRGPRSYADDCRIFLHGSYHGIGRTYDRAVQPHDEPFHPQRCL